MKFRSLYRLETRGLLTFPIVGVAVHDWTLPDGSLRQAILVSAVQTSCCGFGGARLHRLYITTATENWSDEERVPSPQPESSTRATRIRPGSRRRRSARTPSAGGT